MLLKINSQLMISRIIIYMIYTLFKSYSSLAISWLFFQLFYQILQINHHSIKQPTKRILKKLSSNQVKNSKTQKNYHNSQKNILVFMLKNFILLQILKKKLSLFIISKVRILFNMDPLKHAPLKITDIRSKYKVIDKVGKGTYGTVFKVLNLQDNKYYAIKKFQNTEAKLQVQGFPITALREISLLKQLNHPNVINLIEIICSRPNKRNLYRGSTFMVFQYMHHDFSGLFRAKVKFTLSQIKCMMKQILQGCNYLHQNKIMHRDIKSANILLNDEGLVQLADFGLGRRTRFDNVYTYKVVTLWYRAPELLLGCKSYNHKVDVWSIGCVLAQFLTNQVLFKKETQYALIQKIYQICGDLQQNQFTQDYLRGCVYYHQMRPKKSFKNNIQTYIKKINPNVDQITLKFLRGLLELNPYKRLSCQEALDHQFFKIHPLPCKHTDLPHLDVQYHEMFRDRSLKIQRKKETRKDSIDWSQQQEKRNKQKLQINKKTQQPSTSHVYTKNYEKGYSNNYQSSGDRFHHERHHRQSRYQDRRPDYSSKKQYPHYHSNRYHQKSEQKTTKHKKKYSKDRSYSSSSSSVSHSRSRNKKYNYDDKSSPNKRYTKGSSNYRTDREKQYVSKRDQKPYDKPYQRERYEDREESSKDVSKKDYLYDSKYYKEKSSYDYKDRQRQKQRKPYALKHYQDDKYERKQYKSNRYVQKYHSKDQSQKITFSKISPKIQIKPQFNKSQSYSYKQRFSQKQISRQRQKQKQKQRYNERPYHSRESKDYQFRENKDYYSREHKDRDYTRKQHYNNNEDRKYEKSKEKQYNDYEKKDYKLKDYNYRKISNQNRYSPQKKRYSPYKKSMDIQKY